MVGVADLALLRGVPTSPTDLLASYPWGISVAVRLSDRVLDAITPDNPTAAYARHYMASNALLDQITLLLASYIPRSGCRALAIPASQRVGDNRYYGAISHKAVARAAGLGWIGESLLLITPAHGPRIRLSTVLTDLPLVAGTPQTKRCGSCRACIVACPAKALLGIGPQEYPKSRDAGLDVDACARRLKFFLDQPAVGQGVCGVCVQVCPWGKKGASRGRGSEPWKV